MPCRLPFRAFYRGSLVILWKSTVFVLNVTFYVLMWYLGVLKCVKLVTEQESKSRRNILISEYFVQDDNFSADRRGGLSVQNRKYRSRLQHEQNIFSKYMYNVFDGVFMRWSECQKLWNVMWLSLWLSEVLRDSLCDCLRMLCVVFVNMWLCDMIYVYRIFWIMFSVYACLIIVIAMHYRTVYTCMNITVISVSTGVYMSLAFRLMLHGDQ